MQGLGDLRDEVGYSSYSQRIHSILERDYIFIYIVLKMLLGPKRKSLKSAENTKAIGTKTSEGNPYLNSHFGVGYQTVF